MSLELFFQATLFRLAWMVLAVIWPPAAARLLLPLGGLLGNLGTVGLTWILTLTRGLPVALLPPWGFYLDLAR